MNSFVDRSFILEAFKFSITQLNFKISPDYKKTYFWTFFSEHLSSDGSASCSNDEHHLEVTEYQELSCYGQSKIELKMYERVRCS